MKKNFRIFSIILALAIMMSALVIPASAAIPPQPYGDVNSDDAIDILDATNVQRYLARVDLRAINLIEAADVDDDAKITVLDVTIIQQYVAQVISEFPAGEWFLIDKYFYEMKANYDEDKAMVGYPVTFSADGYMYPGPTTASLYINGELVGQTQEPGKETRTYDLVYTFEEAGTYNVTMTLSDKWGEGNSKTAVYTVKDAPADQSVPVITSVTRDSDYNNRPVFTVNAKFGTEPYQYKYTILEYPFTPDAILCETDFIDSNSFDVSEELGEDFYFDVYDTHVFKVTIKDANGNIVSDEHQFCIQTYAPA